MFKPKGRVRYKAGPIRPSETALGKKDAAKRRIVKSGYPRPTPLQTMEEITEYFSHAKITCLLCGNEMGRLWKHLAFTHSMTIKEYQDRFGLPYKHGLVGTDYADFLRSRFDKVRKRFEKGQSPGTLPKGKGRRRKQQPYELDRMFKQYQELRRDETGQLNKKED